MAAIARFVPRASASICAFARRTPCHIVCLTHRVTASRRRERRDESKQTGGGGRPGPSAWLEEVCANLKKNGGESQRLGHFMINFDDGPAYEVVCRSFRVEDK